MPQRSSQAKQDDQTEGELPAGLSQPALRALAGAGVSRLAHLTRFSEDEIRRLHGIGPNALDKLRRALGANGLSYAEVIQAGQTTEKGQSPIKAKRAKRR